MPTTTDVARAYTALLLAGQFAAAREQFWAANIKRIEPARSPAVNAAKAADTEFARAKNTRWLDAKQIDDLTIDGPFVTGNQFALFMDMMITSRANGDNQPFTEIAIFTVCDSKITEERHFYE